MPSLLLEWKKDKYGDPLLVSGRMKFGDVMEGESGWFYYFYQTGECSRFYTSCGVAKRNLIRAVTRWFSQMEISP